MQKKNNPKIEITVGSCKRTINKKVLLCECKRHTAHRVASVRSGVVLAEGGYPILQSPNPDLTWLGVYPSPEWTCEQSPGKEPETGVTPMDRVLWDVEKYYGTG